MHAGRALRKSGVVDAMIDRIKQLFGDPDPPEARPAAPRVAPTGDDV